MKKLLGLAVILSALTFGRNALWGNGPGSQPNAACKGGPALHGLYAYQVGEAMIVVEARNIALVVEDLVRIREFLADAGRCTQMDEGYRKESERLLKALKENLGHLNTFAENGGSDEAPKAVLPSGQRMQEIIRR